MHNAEVVPRINGEGARIVEITATVRTRGRDSAEKFLRAAFPGVGVRAIG